MKRPRRVAAGAAFHSSRGTRAQKGAIDGGAWMPIPSIEPARTGLLHLIRTYVRVHDHVRDSFFPWGYLWACKLGRTTIENYVCNIAYSPQDFFPAPLPVEV